MSRNSLCRRDMSMRALLRQLPLQNMSSALVVNCITITINNLVGTKDAFRLTFCSANMTVLSMQVSHASNSVWNASFRDVSIEENSTVERALYQHG